MIQPRYDFQNKVQGDMEIERLLLNGFNGERR